MIELERDAPDLEDLAAYLDGRLSTERKALVEERLLRDEDYYDVYRETMEFQQEQAHIDGAALGGDVVAPAVWWRSWKVIAPAIAATVLMAFALQHLMLEPSTDELVARLNASEIVAQEGWAEPGWTVLRSGNIAQGRYSSDELAFRIGLRAVDLRVALAAGDRLAVRRLTAMLEMLTDEANLFVGTAYRELGGQIETIEFNVLTNRAKDIEAILAESFEANSLESRRFAIGGWTEAGRLASLAGDAKVLADVFRSYRKAHSSEFEQYLKDLETVIKKSEPSKQDFDAAAAAFSKIARELAG